MKAKMGSEGTRRARRLKSQVVNKKAVAQPLAGWKFQEYSRAGFLMLTNVI